MKRTQVFIMAVLFGLVAGAWNNPVWSQQWTFKLGNATSPDHAYNIGARKYAELVAQKTGGKVKIDIFPATQLGNERDLIEGLQLGTVDLVVTSTGPVGGFIPKMFVVDLPFLFRDRDHAYRVLDGPVGRQLLEAFSVKDIKGLAFWENGFRQITNNARPIEKPEDLKGIKIRTMENKIHLATFKAFGASPTPMAWSEVYTALQQGTIDAQENPIAIIYTGKLSEVQKYLALTGHVYSPALLLMSSKAFTSLPPDIQQIMVDTAAECATFERNLLHDDETRQLEELKAKGMQVTTPNKELFRAAAASVYQEFEGQFGKEMIDQILTTK